jgi:hypothetical protein
MERGLFEEGFEAEHVEGLELHRPPQRIKKIQNSIFNIQEKGGTSAAVFNSVYIIRPGVCKGKNNKVRY